MWRVGRDLSEGKKKRIDVVIRNRNEHVFCSRQYTDELCKMPVAREKGKKSQTFQPSHEEKSGVVGQMHRMVE